MKLSLTAAITAAIISLVMAEKSCSESPLYSNSTTSSKLSVSPVRATSSIPTDRNLQSYNNPQAPGPTRNQNYVIEPQASGTSAMHAFATPATGPAPIYRPEDGANINAQNDDDDQSNLTPVEEGEESYMLAPPGHNGTPQHSEPEAKHHKAAKHGNSATRHGGPLKKPQRGSKGPATLPQHRKPRPAAIPGPADNIQPARIPQYGKPNPAPVTVLGPAHNAPPPAGAVPGHGITASSTPCPRYTPSYSPRPKSMYSPYPFYNQASTPLSSSSPTYRVSPSPPAYSYGNPARTSSAAVVETYNLGSAAATTYAPERYSLGPLPESTHKLSSYAMANPSASGTSGGGGSISQYGQCGGQNWSGSGKCVAPYTCVYNNPWYSQCLSAPAGGSGSAASVSSLSGNSAAPSSGTSSQTEVQEYGQCGGETWTGPTKCVSSYVCTYNNPWYSQCVPKLAGGISAPNSPISSSYISSTTNAVDMGAPTATAVASSYEASSTVAIPSGAASGTGKAPAYGQCGGQDWMGPKKCKAPYVCTYNNPWYSQCVPKSGGGQPPPASSHSAASMPPPVSSHVESSYAGATSVLVTSSYAMSSAAPSNYELSSQLGITYPSSSYNGSFPPASSYSASFPSPSAISPSSSGKAPQYGQCGGIGWKGVTKCVAPFVCIQVNEYYSQCQNSHGNSPSSSPSVTKAPEGSITSNTFPTHSSSNAGVPSGQGTVRQYGQCGGEGYKGATRCIAPFVCVYQNPQFSQCLTGNNAPNPNSANSFSTRTFSSPTYTIGLPSSTYHPKVSTSSTSPVGTVTSSSSSSGSSSPSGGAASWAGANNYFMHAMSVSDQQSYAKKLAALGIKVVRLWVTGVSEGCQKASQIPTSIPDLEAIGSIGTYNDAVLAALDKTLSILVQNGMKAIISPHDGNLFPSQYSNGCDAYCKQFGSSDTFYQSSQAQSDYDNRLTHILTYKSPSSGITWGKWSQAILGFDIQNEPMSLSQDLLQANSASSWFCKRATTMKNNMGKGVQVTTGGIGASEANGYNLYEPALNCAAIDLMAMHSYANTASTYDQCLPSAAAKAKQAGKMVFLEEWGVTQGKATDDFDTQATAINAQGVPWLYWEVIAGPDQSLGGGCGGGLDGNEISVQGSKRGNLAQAIDTCKAKSAVQNWQSLLQIS